MNYLYSFLYEKLPIYKEGLEKAKREDAINLYRELGLPPERIAKILNVPKDKAVKWLKEEKLID
ncbi:hypothetical protein JCM9492_01680 [Aquifex pyrophilus]